MEQNDHQVYTVLELSTIHEDWHKWVYPLAYEAEANEKLEELILYGYEDLEINRVTYQKRTYVVLEKKIINQTMAIYG